MQPYFFCSFFSSALYCNFCLTKSKLNHCQLNAILIYTWPAELHRLVKYVSYTFVIIILIEVKQTSIFNWGTQNHDLPSKTFSSYVSKYTSNLYGPMLGSGLYMPSLKTTHKHTNARSVPRSPKCAASMWLGCFLRMAVRPRAKESMLAEMALMATWLGPAASWMAWWFLAPSDGEWGLAGAASGRQ